MQRTPMRSLRHGRAFGIAPTALILAAALCTFLLSSARADTLASFVPDPTSPGIPDLVWSEAAGSYQLGPGIGAATLTVQTPYVVPGGISSGGATTFLDADLLIAPNSNQAAGPLNVIPGVNIFSQTLSSGQFDIYSAPPSSGGVLLLGGTFSTAYITGMLSSNTGSLVSSNVAYSSGLILNAAEGLPSTATPAPITGGQLSWSLLNANPQFQPDANSFLAPFTANATGQFSAPVPEPVGIVLLLSGIVAFFTGRRCLRRR